MSDKDFVEKYLKDFSSLIKPNDEIIEKILLIKNTLQDIKKNNSKAMIFGNGGSAAIASHVSIDLTKNAGIRTTNYNEADLLTCFSNDYGYDLWSQKALEFYSKPGDVVVLISSSGNSMNIVNAAKYSKSNNLQTITFTGFDKSNKTRKIGDINLWVDSKAYNIVEMTHHIWILSIVDMIIGNAEYSA